MTTNLIETMARAIFKDDSRRIKGDLRWSELYEHDKRPWRDAARAALAAIEAAGYRIVPVEPTKAMRANAVGMKANHINIDLEWANLLAAAPKVTE